MSLVGKDEVIQKGENSQKPAGKRKPPIVSYGEVGEVRAVERVSGMFYEKSFGFMLRQIKKWGDWEGPDHECEYHALDITQEK